WRYFQYHHDVVPEGVTQVRLAVYPKHERKGVAWYLDDFRIRVNSFESIDAAQQAYRARQIDLYDGEIAYFDDQFRLLIEALKRLDQYENTCIVLMSDHGEEFWEHGGTNHGHSLYDELLRVPCIVKLPGNDFAGARVSEVIEMIDIAPTVLEVLNVDPDVRFQGRSASGLWLGGPHVEKRAAFAALLHEERDLSASRTSSAKFIWNIADGSEERFDLLADPLEQSSLNTNSPIELVDATRVATLRDAAGLHILVPREASDVLPLSGTIEGSFGERNVLLTPSGSAQVSQVGNVVRFDVPAPQADVPDILAPVHIVIDVGIETKFALRLDRNGEPLRQDRVGAGRDDRYPFAESGEVILESLLARPTEIDLEHGSDKVYVWYLPDSAVIDLKDVDPDTVQALQALGYLK
ncbi:MAG: sulfatase-like hydrolase/transferase, partial [Candidatus Hydrogenedentota bacterium]